jgi:signal transduction histidine kinase
MFEHFHLVSGNHDARLVILAALLCGIGAHATATTLARVQPEAEGRIGWYWLCAASVVGGATIWATHFVGMLAYRPGISHGYDVLLTAVSIIIAVIAVLASFSLHFRLKAPMSGGIAFGLAVGAMHYTGMMALNIPARFEWNVSAVAASLLVASACGAIATKLFNRGEVIWRRIAGGVFIAASVLMLHFTGMAALTLELDPSVMADLGFEVEAGRMAVAIAIVMAAIILLSRIATTVDLHLTRRSIEEAERLRSHVTELERTKQELQKTAAELASALNAADRANLAKTRFLATMSHELRTPLNAIIGFGEILSRELFGKHSSPQYREYALDIEQSGRHLLVLINDLLDLSRIEADDMKLHEEWFDPRDALMRTVPMIKGQIKNADLALHTDIPPKLPLVWGDERRMRQVLLNILSNAVKFTKHGGSITISAAVRAGNLDIAIADTGIGIDKADIPSALEPFTQIDHSLTRSQDGAGIGLPLAARLMELHDGTLTIDSEVGVGTTIRLRIPPSRLAPSTTPELNVVNLRP